MRQAERRIDIDWLRVLGMVTIFVFHLSRYFDWEDWHVKNPVRYGEMSWVTGILSQWIMPLFFVVSAISIFYSLKSRSTWTFITERIKRLLVPFLLGTFVILIPLQVYIERMSHGQFKGNLWKFYPLYFQGWYGFGGNFAWMGLHLWYLEILLIFSLLTLPLFRFLIHEKRKKTILHLARFIEKPLAIYLYFIPITMIELLVNLDPRGLGMRALGGWSVFTYLMIFILGFTISLDDRISKAIERQRRLSLLLALICLATGIFLLESGMSFRSIIIAPIRSLHTWCWLLTFLGFARRYLTRPNSFLKYANRAVLPFYILHQTMIVAIGFFLMKWHAILPLKWITLAVLSFTFIMVPYEFFIRRFRLFRILFGMKG